MAYTINRLIADADFETVDGRTRAALTAHVLGDKGYDSKALRDAIIKQDAIAVIPPRTTSPQVHCDYALYC